MSLANKYRPGTFEEVVGQEAVKLILQHQIINNDLRQAYLFTGPAGTGKTTMARLVANALDADVVEIDAASNNGVDNIRNIREQCRFKSIKHTYKVYIIDEVHMLSKGAFNAFLKVLEEPPQHVIFILCTTEPDKIIPTILSRCQRFDFRRLPKQQIKERLQQIASAENIQITEESLDYLAYLANGQMRNAISLLDSVSYCTDLRLSNIKNILGNIDLMQLLDLLEHIMNKQAKSLIELLYQMHDAGRNMKRVVDGLLNLVVDLRKVVIMQNFAYVNFEETVRLRVKGMKPLLLKAPLADYYRQLEELRYKIKYEDNPLPLIVGDLLLMEGVQ